MKKVLVTAVILITALAVVWIVNGQDPSFSNVKMVQAQGADDQEDKPHKEIVIAVEQEVNGEKNSGQVRLVFEDAPEIPDSRPDAFGLYLGRAGDTVTLGSGSIEISADIEIVNDQEPVKNVHASHDGAEITFQVTDQTRYLRDTTERPELTPELIKQGQVTVPGTTAPGSLEEMGPDSVVRVWGTSQDGILTADLVVYETIE